MRLGPTCLAASTLASIVACSSGTPPQDETLAAGIVAADNPLVVPPGLTERPGALGDSAAGDRGARPIR
ncbi:MAG TPA: hypothetical protein VJO12_13060 [Stellaceae bacterium]|nr:hypothetical protein [Stellaceae bacterium]